MALRNPAQALAWALSESLRPTRSFEGYCLRATRTCLGVEAVWPNARAAYEAIDVRDRFVSLAPPGVPVWWDVGQYWHVALSLGHGVVWSTDILRAGKLDVVPIALVSRRWDARHLGWSSTLNGVRVAVAR